MNVFGFDCPFGGLEETDKTKNQKTEIAKQLKNKQNVEDKILEKENTFKQNKQKGKKEYRRNDDKNYFFFLKHMMAEECDIKETDCLKEQKTLYSKNKNEENDCKLRTNTLAKIKNVHLLPCRIEYCGYANVSSFFLPSVSSSFCTDGGSECIDMCKNKERMNNECSNDYCDNNNKCKKQNNNNINNKKDFNISDVKKEEEKKKEKNEMKKKRKIDEEKEKEEEKTEEKKEESISVFFKEKKKIKKYAK